MQNKNRIIPQMFDVRPVDQTGDLDLEKIESVKKRSFLASKGRKGNHFQQIELAMFETPWGKEQQQEEEIARIEAFKKEQELEAKLAEIAENNRRQREEYEKMMIMEHEKLEREKQAWPREELQNKKRIQESEKLEKIKTEKSRKTFLWKDMFFPYKHSFQITTNGNMLGFAVVIMAVLIGIGTTSYISKGIGVKGRVLGVSQDGFANLTTAVDEMTHQNFENSSQHFSEAVDNFSKGSKELEEMGGNVLDATRFIPFASKVSSGKNAVEAGKHFASAGQSANEVAKTMSDLKSQINFSGSNKNDISLLDIFKSAEKNINNAKVELDAAQQNMDKISIDDLPKDKQDKFLLIKQNLPEIRSTIDLFLNNSHIFVDLLGGNGPRKYLFLFQNNSEMRATGGFIGSYGLLDIADGHVKNFFIDGIFNPDGQLKDKIVPPAPIQKISAAWSMHDSNWFADFPLSAKKAIMFYEKTGGPNADGLIALTPVIMQKLLEITGPIEMPDYDVTLDADNFAEVTQYKVEVDYDKEENKPKKILSDLAPILFEKLFNSNNLENIAKVVEVLSTGLNEKQILLYSQNSELQNIISQQKWSGEILPAAKDYLSVINTNINGFKTDAVVKESIDHKAEIQDDGSVIDTVTITRKHTGGNSEYEWFNKVNSDYMRVYVPQGSKLLEASGQTRETDNPPLDYDNLGFKRDAEVQAEEKNIKIDSESGTRIYNEKDKTVFANWVYVSPQEEVTVTYKYLLPFSLFKVSVGKDQQLDSYSLVAQKQAGSLGSSFVSHIFYPANYYIKWNFPDNIKQSVSGLKNETTLTTDHFEGVLFEKTQ